MTFFSKRQRISKRNNLLPVAFVVTVSLVTVLFGVAQPCQALPKPAKALDYQLSGTVSSQVSKAESTVLTNTKETLADPVNHPVLLTISAKDSSGKTMEGIKISVHSNRGSVDVVEAMDKISTFQTVSADSEASSTLTDKHGQASIRVTTFIPGKAILTIDADGVTLDPVDINFLALPFPSIVTLEVGLPFTQKNLTLYQPAKVNEEKLSEGQKEAMKSFSTGTVVKVPFLLFCLLVVVCIVSPILVLINFINLNILKHNEAYQNKLLQGRSSTH